MRGGTVIIYLSSKSKLEFSVMKRIIFLLLFTFSLSYSLSYLSHSATLRMTFYNLAPGACSPGDEVILAALRAEASAGTITILSVKIDKTGTLPDGDIEKANLIHDKNNNNTYDTGDQILKSGTFSGGTLTFSNVDLPVTHPTAQRLLISYKIKTGASFGPRFGVELDNSTYVTVSAGHTVQFTNNFVSDQTNIANITVEGTDLAPCNITRGERNIVMSKLRFYVYKPGTTETITKVGVTRTGTATDGNIEEVKLIHDLDNNSRYDSGEPVLGTGRFGAEYVGHVRFNINLTVTSATPQSLLILYTISPISFTSRTIGGRISYDDGHINAAGSGGRLRISPAGFPFEFGVRNPKINREPCKRIVDTTISKRLLVLGSPRILPTPLPNYASPGDTVVIDQLRLRIDANEDINPPSITLNSIKLSREGTGADTDVECVYIYTDNNSDGSFSGETLWASKCNPAFTIGYSTLPINRNITANQDLLVVYKLSAGATADTTIGMEIRSSDYISVDAATKVELAASLVDPAPQGAPIIRADSIQGITCGEILKIGVGTTNYEEKEVVGGCATPVTGFIEIKSLEKSHSAGEYITSHNLFIRTSPLYIPLQRVEICGKVTVNAHTHTRLKKATSAGAKQIEVHSKAGISIGDTLIINRGNPTQETVTVIGFGAGDLVNISPALQYAHAVNEVVEIPTDLAPSTVHQGQKNIPFLRLKFAIDNGSVEIDKIKVTRMGTATADDISRVAIYRDSDADGMIDGGEQLLATSNFTTGDVTLDLEPNVTFSAAAPFYLIIAYDIAINATANNTLGARIAAAGDITFASRDYITNTGDFPLQTRLSPPPPVPTIRGNNLIVSGTNLAPRYIKPGVRNLSMLQVALSAESGETQVNSIKIRRTGTAAAGSISLIAVYDDADADGSTMNQLTGSPDTQLGSTTTDPGQNGEVTISLGANYWVRAAQGPRYLLIVYNISATATTGTVGAEIPYVPTCNYDSEKKICTYTLIHDVPVASPDKIKEVKDISSRASNTECSNHCNELNENKTYVIKSIETLITTDNWLIVSGSEAISPRHIPVAAQERRMLYLILKSYTGNVTVDKLKLRGFSMNFDGTPNDNMATNIEEVQVWLDNDNNGMEDTKVAGGQFNKINNNYIFTVDDFNPGEPGNQDLTVPQYSTSGDTRNIVIKFKFKSSLIKGNRVAVGISYEPAYYNDGSNQGGIILTAGSKVEEYGIIQCYDTVIGGNNLEVVGVGLINPQEKFHQSQKVAVVKLKASASGPNTAEFLRLTGIDTKITGTATDGDIICAYLYKDRNNNQTYDALDTRLSTAAPVNRIIKFTNFLQSVNFVVNAYTRLEEPAPQGAVQIKVQSRTGISPGDTLIIGKGLATQETVKVTGFGAGNFVSITPALKYLHGANETVVEIGNEQYFFVVYTISPTAVYDRTIGAELSTVGFVKVETPNTVSFTETPIISGRHPATIIGNKVYVTPTDYAPHKISPQQKILVKKLDFRLAQFTYDHNYKPQATINSIRIDKKGDIPDDKIKVYLYQDTGNGIYDAGDRLLSSSNFTTGRVVFSNLNSVIRTDAAIIYFLCYEVGAGAKGITGLRISDSSYIGLQAPDEMTPANLPTQTKDILVHELLRVSGVSLAPAKVSLGQPDAVMLRVNLTAAASNISIGGIKIKKIGTSTLDSDIKLVTLYDDKNLDGRYDAGDTKLSTAVFTNKVALFNNLNYQVPAGATKTLFLVYHIADNAEAGRNVGIEVTSNYDVILAVANTQTILHESAAAGSTTIKVNRVAGLEPDSILEFTAPYELKRIRTITCGVTTCDITLTSALEYSHSQGEVVKEVGDEVASAGFPIRSSSSEIVPHDTLKISGVSLAPETVTPGATFAIQRVITTATSSKVKITTIKVAKKGTLADNYIDKVRLYKDSDKDGKFDATKDGLIKETTFTNAIATFDNLAIEVHYTEPVTTFIVLAIPSNSPINETIGIELRNLNTNATSYITVEAPDRVDPANPATISSALTTISEKDTLIVSCENLAPQYIMQGEEKDMLKLKFQTASGSITINSIRIYEDGTSTRDANTEYVKLYNPTINKQANFVSQYVTFRDLNITVTPTAPVEVKIAYKASRTAEAGRTLRVRITSKDWVTVASPDIVSSMNFPLQSTAATIRKGPVTITVTGENVAPATTYPAEKKLKLLKLNMRVTEGLGAATVKSIKIKRTGTAADNDISSVALYDNGTLRSSTTLHGGYAIFTNLNLQITSSITTLFLYYDISSTATIGKTVAGALLDASYIELSTTTDVVKFAAAPITSSEVTITEVPDFLIVSGISLSPASLEQGQPNVAMKKLTLQLAAGSKNIKVDKIKLKKSGSSTRDADVAKVLLYRDITGGTYDTTDVLIASATFSGGYVTFDNLNLELSTAPADKQQVILFVVYDISSTAAVGVSVGVELTDNSFITVTSPDRVKPDNFPLKSNEPTIGGHTLVVAGENLAPAEVKPKDKVAMLKLKMRTLSGEARISKIKVKKSGTSTLDSDIEYAALYLDSPPNGVYDATDMLLTTATFDNGICSFSSEKFAQQITVYSAPADKTLFIIYQIAGLAETGATVGAELTNNTFVEVLFPDTTASLNFPITSTKSYIKDTIPPSAITDLVAEPGIKDGELILKWTAPGDDGDKGKAKYYIIKTYNECITDTNWDVATELANTLVPNEAGSKEEFTISDLPIGQKLFFAIKSVDEANNISKISNCVQGTAPDKSAPLITHTPIRSVPVDSDIRPVLNIKAKVTDNKEVNYVKLFYKKYGEAKYEEKSMVRVKDDEYEFQLPAADITNRGLQYYIETSDAACNIALYDSGGRKIATCGDKVAGKITITPITINAFTTLSGPYPLSHKDYMIIVMYHNRELPPTTTCHITQDVKTEVNLSRVNPNDTIPPIFYIGYYEIKCAVADIATLTVNNYEIKQFTSRCVRPHQKMTVESIDKKLKLVIEENSFDEDLPITVIKAYEGELKHKEKEKDSIKFSSPLINNKLKQVGDAYSVGPIGIKSNKPIKLSIKYDEEDLKDKDIDIGKLGIYYWNEKEYIYLDTRLNKEEKLFESNINQFYTYRLIADMVAPEIKDIKREKRQLLAELTDIGSGIDKTTIIVKINDKEMTNQWEYNEKNNKLTIDLNKVDSGYHKVYIEVKDKVGNSSKKEERFFKPGPISIYRVYTLPNPVGKDGKIRFVYEVTSEPDICRIEVYNIRGDLVKKIPDALLTGAIKQELAIDKIRYIYDATAELDFLSNGVYIYRIIVKEGGTEAKKINKFTIIK